MSAVEIPNPLAALIVVPTGRATQPFREYLQGLNGLRSVYLASLPEPIAGYLCFVLDTVDGMRPCYADGVNWRRFDTNAIVS